jgi:1-acyl-sn-glycerol-3-phosphate acyltransferase
MPEFGLPPEEQAYRYTPGDENNLDLLDIDFCLRARNVVQLLSKYFRYEVEGIENIPEDGPGLIVSPHSTITLDGFLLGMAIYDWNGRVCRGLGDHTLFRLPGIREMIIRLGVVDGNPRNALALFERGDLCFAMPGGGGEAFRSSARRYMLDWEGHAGFVRVAIRAGAPLIPTVCIGPEDAWWMPINALEWGQRLLGVRFPVFLGLGLGPFPLPVKFNAYVGEPIWFDYEPEAAEDDEIVRDCHDHVVGIIEEMIREGLERRSSLWK